MGVSNIKDFKKPKINRKIRHTDEDGNYSLLVEADITYPSVAEANEALKGFESLKKNLRSNETLIFSLDAVENGKKKKISFLYKFETDNLFIFINRLSVEQGADLETVTTYVDLVNEF